MNGDVNVLIYWAMNFQLNVVDWSPNYIDSLTYPLLALKNRYNHIRECLSVMSFTFR